MDQAKHDQNPDASKPKRESKRDELLNRIYGKRQSPSITSGQSLEISKPPRLPSHKSNPKPCIGRKSSAIFSPLLGAPKTIDCEELKEDFEDDQGDAREELAGPAVAGQRSVKKSFLPSVGVDEEQLASFEDGHFVYLRPRRGVNYSVYELEQCTHDQIDVNDYFTLSKDGVTHFSLSQADFTPLNDWEREYELFYQVSSIPFYFKFRLFKNFITWKRNISGSKIESARASLESKLFILNKQLSSAILKVREMCAKLSTSSLFKVHLDKTSTLDDFKSLQAAHRKQVQMHIIAFSDDVRVCVRDACDQVLDDFLAANNIVADVKMTFMERAALRTECRRLARFIRLADYQVADTLVLLALQSADMLWKLVNPPVKAPRKVIVDDTQQEEEIVVHTKKSSKAAISVLVVKATFQEDVTGVVFVPGEQDILQVFEEVLVEGIGLLSACERLLHHEELSAYTQGTHYICVYGVQCIIAFLYSFKQRRLCR